MAKQTKVAPPAADDFTPPPVAAPADDFDDAERQGLTLAPTLPPFFAPAAESAASEAPARPTRYAVTLHCPTPLHQKTMVVEAPNEEAAKAAFDAANGICGSVHRYEVQRIA